MSGHLTPTNWASIIAAAASVASLTVTLAVNIGGYFGARARRLQTHARRHNDSMCTLDVDYDAMSTVGSYQLEVAGYWPPELFLLFDTRVIKKLEDGSRTVDGDFMGRTGAITARMMPNGSVHSAGAEVWRLKPYRSAILRVQVRDRSSQRVVAKRIVRIRPMP